MSGNALERRSIEGDRPVHESNQVESKPGELKHLSTRRKRKQYSDSLSSGERKGNSPNLHNYGCVGVVGAILSTAGPEKSCGNQPGPSGKAKYSQETDSEPVL